jgi:hypothetical protein
MERQSFCVVESTVEGDRAQINVHIALHITFEPMRRDAEVED